MKLPTHFLFLFEQFSRHFSDGDIVLPESGNGQPDILDEARWLLRFYKRLKDELLQKGWGSGGVGGARIFGDLWGENSAPDGTDRPSWQDNTRTWVVSGEDAYVSFWYAAVAAHYHYLLTTNGWADTEGIDWLAEAESVYSWARNRAATPATCHDFAVAPISAYAAVSLYKASGNMTYHQHFLQDVPNLSYVSTNASLTDVNAYAAWQYISLPASRPTDPQVVANALSTVEATANFQLLFPALDNRACRWGGDFWFPMLIGQGTTPFVAEGVMAYALFRDRNPAQALAYKTVLHNTADYFLGNNPLNTTWVTGLGENPPQDIFHIDSWLSPSGGVRLGIVPYGPWRRQYFGPYGWWRAEWAALTTYPDYDLFPGHERWFTQRTAPLTAEFTIHQNNLMSAFLFGALLDTNRLVVAVEPFNSGQSEGGLTVFPNPTTGQLFVELDSGEPSFYRIFNALGQQQSVAQLSILQPINLAHLPKGVYWIQVTDQKRKSQTAKFVKW